MALTVISRGVFSKKKIIYKKCINMCIYRGNIMGSCCTWKCVNRSYRSSFTLFSVNLENLVIRRRKRERINVQRNSLSSLEWPCDISCNLFLFLSIFLSLSLSLYLFKRLFHVLLLILIIMRDYCIIYIK